MALDDFAPATPEGDDDLFDFAELGVEEDGVEPEVSTSSSDEEIMDAVQRAAAEVQEELPPPAVDEESELPDDELVASFPEGMLDADDDDLFAFDDLLSDENGPSMDASIVDEEDRYGMTAKEAAETLNLDETEEEEAAAEESVVAQPPQEIDLSTFDINAEIAEDFDPFAEAEAIAAEEAEAASEDGFDINAGGDEELDLFDEDSIDREAEQEEFASLLADPEPENEPEAVAAAAPAEKDVLQPAPRAEDPEDQKAAPGLGNLIERFALHSNAGKPLLIVLGSFLALNLVLAVLAILAFFRVGSGLEGMKSSLAGSLETIAREADRTQVAPPVETSSKEAEDSSADTEEASKATGTAKVTLEPRERTEIRAARSEIAAGKFEVARRRLFRLLSVADSPLSEAGRIAEEEANLLVAESFEREAHALMEERARLAEEAAREQQP